MKFLRIIGFFATAVVVICAASVGLVYANNRALHLTSNDAELVADTYSVGTAFAGSVQDMLVERGSQVVAGQELFRLQSATLDQALQTQRFSSEGVGYRVEGNDVIVFTAVKDGTVQELNASIGSFVPGNTVIALVGISDSLHLEATFSMSARDYARLPVGGSVSVDMPDGTTETTTIYDVQVTSSTGGAAETVVRARNESLVGAGVGYSGAPVTAELQLNDEEGLGNWVARQVGKLFVPGGFSS
jgi:hypothetical protein